MSIITYPLNGIQYTAEDAETYVSTRTSGVFSANISIIPENMTVTIGSFLAWINNKEFAGKSVVVTEPVTLTIDAPEAVLNRIDRIVLRFDAVQNLSNLVVIKGTASSSPVAPAIARTETTYDLCLCEVTIKAGITSLTNADVKSTLLNETICGIMRDGVTGIPTSQLQAQVEELLNGLQEAIDGVESGSAFMIGDLYDPQKKSKPVAFDDEVFKKENKPTGSYVGDGCVSNRTIDVGGVGSALLIYSSYGFALITPFGGLLAPNRWANKVITVTWSMAKFENGKLYLYKDLGGLGATDETGGYTLINATGATYHYQVL